MIDLTNNRSEGTNSLLKREIGRKKNMSAVVKKLIGIEKNQILNGKGNYSYVKNTFYCPSNVATDFGRRIFNDANHFLGRLTDHRQDFVRESIHVFNSR